MGSSSPYDDGKNSPEKKKKVMTVKRGATRMKRIVRARNKKVVFTVQWNAKGQPIGKNSIKMSSYLGATTRSTVPINIEDWDHVPEALKNSIWEDVQLTFNIPEEKKKWIISQAGLKWKDFKCYLTRKKMFNKSGNINEEPPEIYPFIDSFHWSDFLDSRLSKEFIAISETNRKSAKSNKYPQKKSRKGSARLEQDELAKMASNGNIATSIPRGTMWKLMRINEKTGEVSDDEAREVADKIDMLTERSRQGEFPDSGREDVLFKALGTEEHGGRVRGVGSGVTITEYFGSLANPKHTRDEVKELKSMVSYLKNEVIQMKNQMQNGKDMSSSFVTTRHDTESTPRRNVNDSIPIPEGLTPCKLALFIPTYRIVATGKVHNFPEDFHVIHGKPLLCDQLRVSIEYALENEAILPVPLEDEAYTIIEALGSLVAWPRDLVILDGKKVIMPKDVERKGATSNQEKRNLTMPNLASHQGKASTQKLRTAEGETPKSPLMSKSGCAHEGHTTCRLALEDPTYRVVAKGKVHDFQGNSRVLHGKPLLPNHVRVSLEYSLENEALLPVPLEDEAYTVIEALGTHVAWPRHLVILDGKKVTTPKDTRKKVVTSKQAKPAVTIPTLASHQEKVEKARSKTMQGDITKCSLVSETRQAHEKLEISKEMEEKATLSLQAKTKTLTSIQSKAKSKCVEGQKIAYMSGKNLQEDDIPNLDILPRELRTIFMFVKRMGKDEQIMLPIDKSVVNRSQQVFIGKEELFDLLGQKEIGACHMSAYIMMLYRQCQLSGKINIYGFLCPSSISLVIQTKHEDIVMENRVERSRYIVDVLNATAVEKKVFLAPYNAGHHWILCVIDPYADIVYYMDPLGDKDRKVGDDLRSVVDTALLTFQNQLGASKKVKKNTKWQYVQCPHQTNNTDCGYFVLRFMREIIDLNLTKIPETFLPTKGWPTYTQSQIDDIRIELAHYVLDFAR